MNFDYTEEQTLLDNMVTSFVRDNYDWDTRCNIVKSEEGWKEENWKQFAELGLLGVPFDEAYGGLGGKSTDLMIVMEQFGKGLKHRIWMVVKLSKQVRSIQLTYLKNWLNKIYLGNTD